ncbi:MAG: hypothetical protein JSS82_00260 [Bacteroidetes bacterium]|nr:hypothetical protein [Bacteroidota bacterium]
MRHVADRLQLSMYIVRPKALDPSYSIFDSLLFECMTNIAADRTVWTSVERYMTVRRSPPQNTHELFEVLLDVAKTMKHDPRMNIVDLIEDFIKDPKLCTQRIAEAFHTDVADFPLFLAEPELKHASALIACHFLLGGG